MQASFRAVLAMLLALICTVAVGSFRGYADSPEALRAHRALIDKIAASNPGADASEFQEIYSAEAVKDPVLSLPLDADPPAISILKSNPLLLLAFSLVFLFVAKPSNLSTFLIFGATALALFLVAIRDPSMRMLDGTAISLFLSPGLYWAVRRIINRRPKP